MNIKEALDVLMLSNLVRVCSSNAVHSNTIPTEREREAVRALYRYILDHQAAIRYEQQTELLKGQGK